MKIVAHRPNPTEGLMPIGPTRKAQGFVRFVCVVHPIGQVEPLNGAGVGFRPAQGDHHLGQFTLAKNRADFHLLDPPPLPMFDHLGIHQVLGMCTTGADRRPRGPRRAVRDRPAQR